MNNFKQKLAGIKCFVFDVDGVLTDGKLLLLPAGDPVRTMNAKDGYALRLAANSGYLVVIISGRGSDGVKMRFENLGIKEAHLWVDDKVKKLKEVMERNSLSSEEVLFMGDDMPDLEAMKLCGVACCPADAATDIKQICAYVSHQKGGEGCVRDIIEQVMRLHGKWK